MWTLGSFQRSYSEYAYVVSKRHLAFLSRFVVSNAVLSKSTPNKYLLFDHVRFSYPVAKMSLFN